MQPEAEPVSTNEAEVARHPTWQAADHLLTHLAENAHNHPDQIAMRERDHGIWQETTWAAYLDYVLAYAAGLEAYGIGAEDTVLVIGDNRPALYYAMVASAALKAVPSPAYPDTPPGEIRDQLQREATRWALAEDQEQVDKLLSIRGDCPRLELVVYDDPRGLAGKEPDGVVAFSRVADAGWQRLAAEPGLREALLQRPDSHDHAVLLHSSGTTGAPKGVPLKHGHVLCAVRNAASAGYFRPGETHMAYLPMAWVGDYIFSIAAAILLRFSVNIPEVQETAQHDLREIAPTVYFSSPRAWANMLTRIHVGMDESPGLKRRLYRHFMPFAIELERRRLAGRRPGILRRAWRAVGEVMIYGPIKDHLGLSRVGRAYSAGEAIGEEDFLFFRALGLELRQFYGQTENCALCAAHDPRSVKLHTVGPAFPGVELAFTDAGEILVRGENVFDGYYEQAEATTKSLRDGWLHTGDAGYLEDDGQLVVLGRVSEVVYTAAGERFIATYVENHIKFSQYVRDVCVLGEGQQYLAAIVCIDIEAVGHWAEENGIAYHSYADLSQQPDVYELIKQVIGRVNGILPSGLQIHRFVNLHKPFDPDDGEVTRTRKLRRSVINEHYGPIITALYDASDAVDFHAQVTYESGESHTTQRTLAVADVHGGREH